LQPVRTGWMDGLNIVLARFLTLTLFAWLDNIYTYSYLYTTVFHIPCIHTTYSYTPCLQRKCLPIAQHLEGIHVTCMSQRSFSEWMERNWTIACLQRKSCTGGELRHAL
jgi:hypothetical protein